MINRGVQSADYEALRAMAIADMQAEAAKVSGFFIAVAPEELSVSSLSSSLWNRNFEAYLEFGLDSGQTDIYRFPAQEMRFAIPPRLFPLSRRALRLVLRRPQSAPAELQARQLFDTH